MYPDEDSVNYAKEAIKAVMDGREMPEPIDETSSAN